MTPMMQQYFEVKNQYPDFILFYRLGDFYEMFFEDAQIVSSELELTLTGRDCGEDQRAPMCGVPYHAAETYIGRLIEKGYKVAICEQMEDPKFAKDLVKREVIRIITPGTLIETDLLNEKANNYLATLYYDGDSVGLCFADISTAYVTATAFRGQAEEAAVQMKIDALYDQITGHPVYAAYLEAKAAFDALTNEIFGELQYVITGQRPCAHDCSSCASKCH